MLRCRVNVNHAVTEVGYTLVYGTPKNHSRRSVPFPYFLSEMLAARCEGKKPSDFVFTSPGGDQEQELASLQIRGGRWSAAIVGPPGLESPTEPPADCAVWGRVMLGYGRHGPDCSAAAHDGFFYSRAHVGDMIKCTYGKVEGR